MQKTNFDKPYSSIGHIHRSSRVKKGEALPRAWRGSPRARPAQNDQGPHWPTCRHCAESVVPTSPKRPLPAPRVSPPPGREPSMSGRQTLHRQLGVSNRPAEGRLSRPVSRPAKDPVGAGPPTDLPPACSRPSNRASFYWTCGGPEMNGLRNELSCFYSLRNFLRLFYGGPRPSQAGKRPSWRRSVLSAPFDFLFQAFKIHRGQAPGLRRCGSLSWSGRLFGFSFHGRLLRARPGGRGECCPVPPAGFGTPCGAGVFGSGRRPGLIPGPYAPPLTPAVRAPLFFQLPFNNPYALARTSA